jgi:hypothetical protein
MTARDAFELGMHLTGYDPGLSVKSALKLPRSLTLADSIASAVANADYISINIPYIKGTQEDGGTHGIIGVDVIEHFKPNAVLLNFARGELVDSEALKEFLDKGEGRYVSDFPDDLLWNHENAIIFPHLGASTEEAEDSAVRMIFRASYCMCVGQNRLLTLLLGIHGCGHYSRLSRDWNDSKQRQLSGYHFGGAKRGNRSSHGCQQELARKAGSYHRSLCECQPEHFAANQPFPG